MPYLTRLDNDENPETSGCRFFGGCFLLDDRFPEKGFGTSPYWVFADRAAELSEVEAERVAQHLRGYYKYTLKVGPLERVETPKDQIIADMKSGKITRQEGAARLRALAQT